MRILHTMLRVGDLDKSIDFYVNRLGMNLLRKKDYPHGKFTLAFVGYGSEKENTVIELTYNWDKKSEDYELGDKYGHIAIGVKDIHLNCQGLENGGCKIIGDKILKSYYKGQIYPAKEKDWSTEYLASIVSVKVVKNSEEAIKHINKYGTMHTDSIITKNKKTAKYFLKNVKSSIAMHNTSTQFADGGEFGFGGEVGISTNTLPPRGPVGLNQLISYKYEITSNGKIRN